MAQHQPSCTGLFQRSCSFPQTFFSPHGRDEALMQEGTVRELPLWEREPSLFLLGSFNYSPEVREAAGFGPEKEPCCSRHFVSATARFSYYSCIEPSVWSSVLWKLPEKDIADVKVRQSEYILASTSAHCFNRGHFGSSLAPQEDDGLSFSWSRCCPRLLVKGWPRRR